MAESTQQEEQDRLQTLYGYSILDTPPDGSFDRITRILAAAFNVPIAVVSLVDEDRIWFKSKLGVSMPQIDKSPGLCASAILSDGVYEINDAIRDPRSMENALVKGEAGIRFYAAHPITTHEGFRLGNVAVLGTEPRSVSQAERQLLQELAGTVMDMIEFQLAAQIRIHQEEVTHRDQRLKSMGALSEGLAHDFNNLLSIVMNLAEVTMAERRHDTQLVERLKSILNASEQGAALCKQLMTYAGKTHSERTAVDLSDAVKNMQALLRAVVDSDIEIKLECDKTSIPVLMDATALNQIIMNLCVNANEAIEGSGTISIRTSRDADNRQAILEVCDDGCGIAPEVKTQLMEPFFSQKSIGRGLGLSVVDGIVRRHQGEIEIESELGAGSTFRIRFPIAAVKAATKTDRETVLIVDDDEPVLDSYLVMLNATSPYHVIGATNAEDALRTLREHEQMKCVILDINMPTMNGVELFEEMRNSRPLLEGILITGANSDNIIPPDGIRAVLQKPVRVDELMSHLNLSPSSTAPRPAMLKSRNSSQPNPE